MELKGGLVLLGKRLSEDKKVRLIVGLGLLGMVCILASSFFSSPKQQAEKTETAFSDEAYLSGLEKRLRELIEAVEGVGRAEVMVTLVSSQQTVYATEKKDQSEALEDISEEGRQRTQHSQSSQQSYLLVDQGSGRKQALVETRLTPEIRGVVVVCRGADSKLVHARVTDVVTTALGIGANKVCVVKGGT